MFKTNSNSIVHATELQNLVAFLKRKDCDVIRIDSNSPDLLVRYKNDVAFVDLKTGKECVSSKSYEHYLRYEWTSGIPVLIFFVVTKRIVTLHEVPRKITGSAFDYGKVLWFQ